MEPILKVQDLKKDYHRPDGSVFTAVDGISFTVERGCCMGLVGESGSGKSTTAKLITRLEEPTAGSITLCGTDITNITGAALRTVYRNVQMVFQSPSDSFDPRRTLGDGIAESLRNAGVSAAEAKRRVSSLLVHCGLTPEFAKQYPHEVSGGQCQRAAIARAIAIQPKLLICDEATSALDVTVQAQIVTLLRQLREELNISVLFICHDLALVQQICDSILVMYRGKIVERGTPDAVIQHPHEIYTQRLINAVL